jgi:hypothetical protein
MPFERLQQMFYQHQFLVTTPRTSTESKPSRVMVILTGLSNLAACRCFVPARARGW